MKNDQTAEHVTRVDVVHSRYPYLPACSRGCPFRGYVAEHAARGVADAHAAEHAPPADDQAADDPRA